MTLHTLIGGAGSVLGGGKFANGAVTGAFAYLFNDFENRTVHPDQIINNTKWRRQAEAAWDASNPYGKTSEKREVQFYTVATLDDRGNVTDLNVGLLSFGEYGVPEVNPGFGPSYDYHNQMLIDFHIHPFTSDDVIDGLRYDDGPGKTDQTHANNGGYLGIIRNRNGYCITNTRTCY